MPGDANVYHFTWVKPKGQHLHVHFSLLIALMVDFFSSTKPIGGIRGTEIGLWDAFGRFSAVDDGDIWTWLNVDQQAS